MDRVMVTQNIFFSRGKNDSVSLFVGNADSSTLPCAMCLHLLKMTFTALAPPSIPCVLRVFFP